MFVGWYFEPSQPQWSIFMYVELGREGYLLTIVKRRKLQWYGHVSCSSGLTKIILQSTVRGSRETRQTKEEVENNIREWTGLEFANSQQWRTEKNAGNWL